MLKARDHDAVKDDMRRIENPYRNTAGIIENDLIHVQALQGRIFGLFHVCHDKTQDPAQTASWGRLEGSGAILHADVLDDGMPCYTATVTSDAMSGVLLRYGTLRLLPADRGDPRLRLPAEKFPS